MNVAAPSVLVVDHSSKLGGAELCLLDIVKAFGSGSHAFLFQSGPLCEALESRGIDVMLSKRSNDFGTVKKDASLLRALPHLGRMAAVVREIAVQARRHQLVYANSQKAFVLAALATSLTRRRLIWHLHDILSAAHFGAAQRRVAVALANRCAAHVIVPSRAAATAFIDSGGRASLVVVIANGLDIFPDPLTPDQLRTALELPKGFLFGVFSRISPWKGQHVAIEALAEMPDAHCIIVGDALFGEDAYADGLRETAKRLAVADRVWFLGYRQDVSRLMQAVDVMVHPSVAPEPFGRTLVEAMLCRVPVIAANNGAAPEILDYGRAGILVAPGDVRALVDALRSVEAVAPSMVDYAEHRARSFYNAPRMLADVQELLIHTAGV